MTTTRGAHRQGPATSRVGSGAPSGRSHAVATGPVRPGRRRLAFLIPVLLLSCGPGRAADAPPRRAAELLAGRATGETPLMDDLRELCDTIGGRITGSESSERAIEWSVRRLEGAGLDRVWTEEFEVPLLWLPGAVEVAVTSPVRFAVPAVAMPFSPVASAVRGSLVTAGSGRPEDFEALGGAARGAIALVTSGPMDSFDALFAEYMRNGPMLAAAEKAGVAGLLVQSTRAKGLLYRHPATVNGTMAPVPVVIIGREEAARLIRLGGRGPVEISLAVDARTGGPFTSRNVLAEIPGREKPDEIVLLGAHLDSWDLGTGAEDNGVNVALVIDVARGLRELGVVPRRTIRFALFTGEEQGLWGSWGYVRTHAAELSRHAVAVIHDTGSGKINGFLLNGREELRAPVERALGAVGGFGPFVHSIAAIDGTDNFDFLLSGVPNLVADQAAAPYLPDYHASSDTFDVVDAREAKINAAIAAALVWHFAEMDALPAARQSRAQVQSLLEANGLVEVMKAFGQYEAWEAGRRGVQP